MSNSKIAYRLKKAVFNSSNKDFNKKGIYRVFNAITNKSYIGKTEKSFRERLNSHIKTLNSKTHHNKHLQTSFNNQGEYFCFEIIESFDNNSDVDLNSLEMYYIREYDSYKNGYNQTLGGEGLLGVVVSEETKMKVLKANKGMFYGESHSQSKVKEEDVISICKMIIDGKTNNEISHELDISSSIIRHIRNGDRWSHVVSDYMSKFPPKRRNQTITNDLKESLYTPEYVFNLYKTIKNKEKVAKKLGVRNTFITKRLREYEVKTGEFSNKKETSTSK